MKYNSLINYKIELKIYIIKLRNRIKYMVLIEIHCNQAALIFLMPVLYSWYKG